MHFRKLFITGLLCGWAVISATVVQAQVEVTYSSAPGVEFTNVSSATTENFDGFTAGSHTSLNTAVGTLTAGKGQYVGIVTANQYGGGSQSLSGTGGTGKYVGVGNSDEPGASALSVYSDTLTFNTPQDYIGGWWSALDGANELTLYSGSSIVAQFNESTLQAFLNNQNNMLTGSNPTAPTYLGNPNGTFKGQDNSEDFTYLNFFGLNGETFTSAVFTQNSAGADFEFDNVSTSTTYTSQELASSGNVAAIITPEPSEYAVMGLGIVGLFGLMFMKRREATSIV